MRLYASKLGYTLSDKVVVVLHWLSPVHAGVVQGLFRCGRDASRIKVWTGSEIPCFTEREVFEVLNLDYK